MTSALTAMHKPVLVHLELLDDWQLRDVNGRWITVTWGEPDADGVYTPTFTSIDDGKVLIDRNVLDELERRAGGVRW